MEEVDMDRAREEGLSVSKRRSGGGAVLIVPGEHLWLDFLVPRGDPLWDDDIVAAANWVGELWAVTLESSGFEKRLCTTVVRCTPRGLEQFALLASARARCLHRDARSWG